MIVLDLFSEASPQWIRTNSYYGKKWAWCLLHGIFFEDSANTDFGGVLGLEGNLPDLTTQPLFARDHTPSMAGIGLTMEGQEGNEVILLRLTLIQIVYTLLLAQAWSNTSIDSAQYVIDWIERRYGPKNTTPQILQAWELLRLSVYNNTYQEGIIAVPKSVFV
jgi:alpha-N-acetylglucosaminidase